MAETTTDRTDALIAEARRRVHGVTFDPCTAECPAAHLAAAQLAALLADEVERLTRERDALAEPARLYRLLIPAADSCGTLDLRTPDGARVYIRGARKPVKSLHEWVAGTFKPDTPEQAEKRAALLASLSPALATPTPAAPGARGA